MAAGYIPRTSVPVSFIDEDGRTGRWEEQDEDGNMVKAYHTAREFTFPCRGGM